MNFFKIAAIAAVVVSSSAMASDLQFGWPGNGGGHGGNSDPQSTLKVFQHGANNSATALQADARKSTTDIKQYGSGNFADVGQGADDATITLVQKGHANSATLDQWEAKGSTIDVSQYGYKNNATVNQTAAASSVDLTQIGYNNQANLQQH
ncbi:curli major subunit CsgA [Buttiauxella sp. WJP83]|uniref:Curli major subunit CsgA n=1 Tax=Buttiauxella selenatireducens TaxID=3073902 RepID=A0ABY9S7B1_9ENTR|nr:MULTISPECIES: curli major subunit CsgA [unclassified Buttiauxella]WBM69269.1 curli major subunit CsgA [Buttiauxella sp. WJP83]WMY72893.1 curli major subunit CsgA [Buttiauxella sp. R73]GDX06811.1 major curlin subunit CsgA [Buttiauxella sp. A111]